MESVTSNLDQQHNSNWCVSQPSVRLLMVTWIVDKYTELYTDIDLRNRFNGHFNNNRGASLGTDDNVRQVIADRRQRKACPDIYRRAKIDALIGLTSSSRLLTRPLCHGARPRKTKHDHHSKLFFTGWNIQKITVSQWCSVICLEQNTNIGGDTEHTSNITSFCVVYIFLHCGLIVNYWLPATGSFFYCVIIVYAFCFTLHCQWFS